MRTLLVLVALALAQSLPPLPNKADSLKFAVVGNAGKGDRTQYQLADQMARLRERFKFDLVILAGGNIFGSEKPRDYLDKFETPYKPLLSSGVTFQAALGSDDSRAQRFYQLFNMDGRLYYSFTPKPGVRFFALDAGAPAREQTAWLEQQLRASNEPWKIAFFHDPRLRKELDPLFTRHNVVVLSGKDMGTERFLAAEIAGNEMFYASISREGQVLDSGSRRR